MMAERGEAAARAKARALLDAAPVGAGAGVVALSFTPVFKTSYLGVEKIGTGQSSCTVWSECPGLAVEGPDASAILPWLVAAVVLFAIGLSVTRLFGLGGGPVLRAQRIAAASASLAVVLGVGAVLWQLRFIVVDESNREFGMGLTSAGLGLVSLAAVLAVSAVWRRA